jgi:hypothetical protein
MVEPSPESPGCRLTIPDYFMRFFDVGRLA